MNTARILVVEDEAIIAADLSDRLTGLGYLVVATVPSGDRALQVVSQEKPDIVLMDIFLQGNMTGIEAADTIRKLYEVPVVYVTSHADSGTLHSATQTEPFGYVLKPFDLRELQVAIHIALYRHQVESKLRKIERWLATTLQSIGDGVIATDQDGFITLLNPVAEKLTGWRQSEALGCEFNAVFQAIDVATGQPVEDLVQRALHHGFSVGLEEHICIQKKSGLQTPIDDSIAPIRNETGEVSGVVVVFRDCTERKLAEGALRKLNEQLEHRVQERTSELEAANKELAAFSYSVSHDLRAPLRAVNGFSHLLAEKYAHILDKEGKYFLDTITKNSSQLGQMIDDFLRLFRLRKEPLRIRSIDMTQLVRDVAADLAAQTPTRPPKLEIPDLPSVEADPGLIRQVWVNLLTNAFKFTRNQNRPLIEVGGKLEGEHVHYFVKDNGAGFDMRYANKLFGMFQRLHSADDYEGNGIGLATVSRIVQRHGGQVHAEGALNQGATFSFTLQLNGAKSVNNADEGVS